MQSRRALLSAFSSKLKLASHWEDTVVRPFRKGNPSLMATRHKQLTFSFYALLSQSVDHSSLMFVVDTYLNRMGYDIEFMRQCVENC